MAQAFSECHLREVNKRRMLNISSYNMIDAGLIQPE